MTKKCLTRTLIVGFLGIMLQPILAAQWHTFDPYGPQPEPIASLNEEASMVDVPEETPATSQDVEIEQQQSNYPMITANGYTSADYTKADVPTDELKNFAQGFGSAKNADNVITKDAALQAFMWVRNNIKFVPYPGSKRGAHLTWVERTGNDFDTCALLRALLTSVGYEKESIIYRFANVPYFSDALEAWLGVGNGPEVPEMLKKSLYMFKNPHEIHYSMMGGTSIPRVWLVLNINGVNYVLDPSFKNQNRSAPVDLGIGEIGYSAAELRSKAGGAASGNIYATGPSNVAEFNNKLTEYAINLDDYLRAQKHNQTGVEVGGIPAIEPAIFIDLPRSLPGPIIYVSIANPEEVWTGIPKKYSVELTLEAQVKVGTETKVDAKAVIYTNELTGGIIQYRAKQEKRQGDYGQYQYTHGRFIVEDKEYGGVAVTSVRAFPNGFVPDGEATISAIYKYPFLLINGQPYQESGTFSPVARCQDIPHVICYGFGNTAGRLKWFLSNKQTLGDVDYKYAIGMQHFAGHESFVDVFGGVTNSLIQNHLLTAIVSIGKSPSIDLPCNLTTVYPRGRGTNSEEVRKISLALAYWNSGMEHTCIEQSIESKSALSTVKMLKKSVESGQSVHLVHNATEFGNIKGQLSNYTADEQLGFEKLFPKSDRLLIPANGKTQYDQFKGHGYVISASSPMQYGMIISGNLSGGSGSGNTYVAQEIISQYNNRSDIATMTPASQEPVRITDPVDASNGSFFKETTDLTLGDGLPPMGLAFARYYSSALSSNDIAGVGRGWTHNYDMRLSFRHPTDFRVERSSASELAPLVIAAKALYDLFDYNGGARDWVLPAFVACWGTGQLLDSRAAIAMGYRTLEFVKRPDGSYAPPAGIDASLKLNGGNLELEFHKGLKIMFPSAGGKFTSMSDTTLGDSYKITASYNNGRLSKLTDGYGRYIDFAYSGNLLSCVKDSIGRHVYYDRSTEAGQNVLSVRGPDNIDNHVSRSYFDGNYRLIKIVDAENRPVVSNAYDVFGRVCLQHTFDDSRQHWTINTAEGITRTIDPYGHSRWYFFDNHGRLWAETNELGKTTTRKYDGSNRVTSVVSPEGRTVKYTYDERHRVISMNDPAGTDHHIIPETDGSLTRTVFDGEGNATTHTYNAKHQIVSVKAPGGIESTFAYDSRGRVSQIHPASYAAGKIIQYTYQDATNHGTQKITATFPDDTSETAWLNAQGDIIQTIDRSLHRTTYTYNNRRQLETVSRWDGVHAHNAEPAAAPASALTTRITYDFAGDIKTITNPDDKSTGFTYDALGNVLMVTDAKGSVVQENGYDYRNNLTVSYGALGEEVSWDYDAAGRVTAITNPLKKTTMFTYDMDGLATSVTTPAGNQTAIDHDALGNPKVVEDPAGEKIRNSFDKDSRQTVLKNRRLKDYTTTYDLAGPTITITGTTPLGLSSKVELNARGLVARATTPSSRTLENIEFDDEGHVKKQAAKSGGSTLATRTYTYLPNGLVSEISETIGGQTRTTKRFHDAFDRLISYQDLQGGIINYTIRYAYDRAGNLTTLTYPDNSTVNYGYDANGRLTTVTDWDNRVTRYEYDKTGRPRKVTRPNQTVRNIVWDGAGQARYIDERGPGNALIWMRACDYDPDGNITRTMTLPSPGNSWAAPLDEITYDADNRISKWNGTDVTHDADGNMKTGPLPNGTTGGYDYDMYDRLISSGGVSNSYNPDGLRIQSGGDSHAVDPNAGLSRVLSRTKDGAVTKYVWGLGLLYEEDSSGNIKTYHVDHLGSTVALSDNSGTVTDRWEYSSYGTVTHRTGTSDTPFQFHGGLGCMTDSNGLVYMRARYYNPHTMRFLNADPIGFAGGLNWYAFVGNNPLRRVDPSGLWEGFTDISNAPGLVEQAGVEQQYLLYGRPTKEWEAAMRNMNANNRIIEGINSTASFANGTFHSIEADLAFSLGAGVKVNRVVSLSANIDLASKTWYQDGTAPKIRSRWAKDSYIAGAAGVQFAGKYGLGLSGEYSNLTGFAGAYGVSYKDFTASKDRFGLETTLGVIRLGGYINPYKINDPKYQVELIKYRFSGPPSPFYFPAQENNNRCGK